MTFLVQETNSPCFSFIIQCNAEMNFKSSHTSYQVLFCVLNEALICSLLVRRLPLAWAQPLPAQLLQRKSFRCLPELCLPESHTFLLSTPTHMFRLLSGHYRYIQKNAGSFHSFGGALHKWARVLGSWQADGKIEAPH